VSRPDPEAVMAAYRAAYEGAYGWPIHVLRYERGWFVLGSGRGLSPARYRAADIVQMTERLRNRVSS
jgi:hypothetical protein